MATQTLYGSNVAHGTLTNACKASNTTGGTETTVSNTFSGSNTFGEIRSQGGADASVSAIPSTPTGRGYAFTVTQAGTYATGNWSGNIALKDVGGPYTPTGVTVVFSKYSGGSYTELGRKTLSTPTVNATRTALSLGTVSVTSFSVAVNDIIYWSYWWNDSGISTDLPVNHASNSGTAGVANDAMITTSDFTASGGGVTHRIISDGMGGMFQ